ncbi:hypothetical protein M5C72_12525 [Companilactobacillus allii]|uniref:Uncharacterized protein n=1 Tax=Companilactobacillus allii TaxID=1847728 RepID=A0A1P8Q155_9LACO|nr:hypothetical protein [Companilactobacillus allii]APX71566.1 hypothetical protein BTM29_02880 [Companilactobacillus allii]USQ68649.1 hypothetical protein M5C72_12525 [Companilactobacillus allii]
MSPESITIFPYKPFDIEYGMTIFNLQNEEEFSNLLFNLNQLKKHEAFIDDVDQYIHFYVDEEDNLKTSLKQVAMLGDLTSYNINSVGNLKLVFQKIVADNQVINRDKLESLNKLTNLFLIPSMVTTKIFIMI